MTYIGSAIVGWLMVEFGRLMVRAIVLGPFAKPSPASKF